MIPSLPQHDADASTRAAGLAAARGTWAYSYAWPPGVAVAAAVPREYSYSASYVAHLLPISWDLFKNALALGPLAIGKTDLMKLMLEEMARVPLLHPHDIGQWFHTLPQALADHMTAEDPTSLESYGALYQELPAPPVVASWDDDRVFAWQRIAGANPMLLARVGTVDGDVAVAAAERGDTTLLAAAGEERLFACDYAILAAAKGGVTFGRQKYLPAPYALFQAVDGTLRPAAIRTGGKVYTPADGYAWRLAKLDVQVADANWHEAIAHLGRTHMVMEAVSLATRRQLSARHPLCVLLTPHFEYTNPINHSAATNLIVAGGVIDRCFGAEIGDTAAVVRAGLDGFSLMDASPHVDLAARGLDDRTVIHEHPYRDDALPVYDAIRAFVARYVALYYASDADVAADRELAAFVVELGAEDGGRVRGVPLPTTIDALVTLVANVIWTASGQHAAVNFTQFPYMSFAANMSGAGWGSWPGSPDDLDTHLKRLPPWNIALQQLNTVYQLSSLRVNHLGRYDRGTFADGRVELLVDAFLGDLGRIDDEIAVRDASRLLPYPHLRPSLVPNSIHI